MHLQCKQCRVGATDCCARQLLSVQPDFQAQRSQVQEVIENHGHLCIFLLKFHCKLNPIEYFWGAVKKYLHDHCDYTFETLKENMPKALASVDVSIIQKWEHQMCQWMDVYRDGLDASAAQLKVRQNSSCKYASHHHVQETVARQFDN